MRILKIDSLPSVNEDWVDRDEIMLHACFQILEDCIEKEHVDTHCNYEANKDMVDEIRFLSKWWKERINRGRHIETEDEDDAMLLRLMEIRRCLWV